MRVLAHVRQRLLRRPQQHDLELAVEPRDIRRHRHRHAGLALERRREPPECVGESGVAGDGRERGHEPAGLDERFACHLLHELHVATNGCRGLALERLEPVARPLGHHHEAREALRDGVVDLAREPRPLVGDACVAVHRGELALRRLELVEEAPAFGAELGDATDPEPERDAEADRQRRDGEADASPARPSRDTYPTTIATAMSRFAMIALRRLGAVDQMNG